MDGNERLREVLPFFRPRSAELTPFTITVLVLLCIGIVALVLLYYARIRRHRRELEERFLEQGLEKKLSVDQVQSLLQIANQRKMKSPLQLLSSVHVFDRHVGEYTESLAERDPADPLLGEIGDIRALLGFDRLAPNQLMRSTRQLEPGQTLMAWSEKSEKEGYAPWLVVERDERAIQVVPVLREDTRLFDSLEPGEEVSMRFWREGDTEYHFTTEILDIAPGSRTITIRHTRKVERLQNRDFFRVEVHFDIELLALAGAEEALAEAEEEEVVEETPEGPAETPEEPPEEEVEVDLDQAPRLRGEVLDLSAGGLNVLLHDPLPPRSRLLIAPDFEGPFPLAGIVCQVITETQEPAGTSLKLQFVDLPPAQENEIVRLVYQHQTLAQGSQSVELSAPPAADSAENPEES